MHPKTQLPMGITPAPLPHTDTSANRQQPTMRSKETRKEYIPGSLKSRSVSYPTPSTVQGVPSHTINHFTQTAASEGAQAVSGDTTGCHLFIRLRMVSSLITLSHGHAASHAPPHSASACIQSPLHTAGTRYLVLSPTPAADLPNQGAPFLLPPKTLTSTHLQNTLGQRSTPTKSHDPAPPASPAATATAVCGAPRLCNTPSTTKGDRRRA